MRSAGYLALLLTLSLSSAQGSPGDRASDFQGCLEHCTNSGCAPIRKHNHSCRMAYACEEQLNMYMPVHLRITRWSCEDDCKYQCMVETENHRRSQGLPAIKYYGKWPFKRVWGMQEGASVLFSLANMLAHIYCLARLVRACRASNSASSAHSSAISKEEGSAKGGAPVSGEDASSLNSPSTHYPGGAVKQRAQATKAAGGSGSLQKAGGTSAAGRYPFLWLWVCYGVLHVNAWLWSAVFHTRDTRATERLDYPSAIAVVAMGLAAALTRVLRRDSPRSAAPILAAVGLASSWHLHYMLAIKFDYGWNVKVCVAAGVATALVWVGWAVAGRGKRHPGRPALLLFMLLAHAALALEVLDFPPIIQGPWKDMYGDPVQGLGLVDAHALWHASTVPLTFLFYRFLAHDVTAWARS